MSTDTIYRCDNLCGAETPRADVVNAEWLVLMRRSRPSHFCSEKCLAEYVARLDQNEYTVPSS